jgi:hypothetical protein
MERQTCAWREEQENRHKTRKVRQLIGLTTRLMGMGNDGKKLRRNIPEQKSADSIPTTEWSPVNFSYCLF